MLAKIRKIYEHFRLPKPKVLRAWRMVDLGEDVGCYCFFDPRREKICVYPLTSPEPPSIMENMISMSALETGTGVAPHQVNLFRKGLDAF